MPPAARLRLLSQLVNLGPALLRYAAIVKEGLGQSFAQRDGVRDLVGDERRLRGPGRSNAERAAIVAEKGGDLPFSAAVVGPVSAQLSRPRTRSATTAKRRLRPSAAQGWAKSAPADIVGSAALEGRLRRCMTDGDALSAGLVSTFCRSYARGRRACRHLTPAEPKHPERDQRQPK